MIYTDNHKTCQASGPTSERVLEHCGEIQRSRVYTVKIEQTYQYPNRMKYIPQTDSFVEKDVKSLSYERNVRQPYGWIKESGTPPCEHLDGYVMTQKEYRLGMEEEHSR